MHGGSRYDLLRLKQVRSSGETLRRLATLTLPTVGRITLRLRGGQEFRHQTAAFEVIVSGKAVPGELTLHERRSNISDRRNGTVERDGSGARYHSRVMGKLVGWLPRQPHRELDARTCAQQRDRDRGARAQRVGQQRSTPHS